MLRVIAFKVDEYSSFWEIQRWFINCLRKVGVEFSLYELGGLDDWGMMGLSAYELSKVINEIEDGDVVFMTDIWFGADIIRRECEMTGRHITLLGMAHGSVFMKYDVAQQWKWAKSYEEHLYECCDLVFVGSKYVKNVIEENIGLGNVKWVGFPLDIDELRRYRSNKSDRNRVLYTQKPITIKGYDEWLKFKDRASTKFEHLKFYETYKMGMSKAEFWKFVGRGGLVLSFSRAEMFPYAILEPAILGCDVLVVKDEVYDGIIPKDNQYENIWDGFIEWVEGADKIIDEEWLRKLDGRERIVNEIRKYI